MSQHEPADGNAENPSDEATQPMEMEMEPTSRKGTSGLVDDYDEENNEGNVSSDGSDAEEAEVTFVQTAGSTTNGDGGTDVMPIDSNSASRSANPPSNGATLDEDEVEEKEEDTSDLPPRPAEPEKEKAIIKEIMESSPVRAGETWYVVSSRWYRSWKQHVNYDSDSHYLSSYRPPKPEAIDNLELVDDNTTIIRRGLSEDYHYEVLPKKAWRVLRFWYTGGPALPRKVIANGRSLTNLVIEIRPLQLKVVRSTALANEVSVRSSKMATIGDFKERLCKKLGLDPANVRLWDYHGRQKIKQLLDIRETLDDAQIIDNQLVLFEEKNADGTWPPDLTNMSSRSTGSYYDSYSGYYGNADAPGLVGLTNLGNTCFMNSALQCLSNTPPLVDFFLSGQYREDINRDNPLGMKGELADEFSALVRQIWAPTPARSVTPRDFKWRLERFAPQFGGYQQHDSQELLAFLLDGLHEDLNRIRRKPYVSTIESDGRPDTAVAAEAWNAHKSRNHSRVVDWFQGQLKSTLVCPVCSRVSITFDPFMYLSLPLPIKGTRTMYATVWWRDGNHRPTKYGVEVEKVARVADFRRKLEQLSGITRLHITEVLRGRYMRHFTDADPVEAIQPNDIIFAYEVGVPLVEPRAAGAGSGGSVAAAAGGVEGVSTVTADTTATTTTTSTAETPAEAPKTEQAEEPYMALPLLQRKEDPYYRAPTYYYAGSTSSSAPRMVLHGLPYVISVKASHTYKEVYNEVVKTICRFVKVPIPLMKPIPKPAGGEKPKGEAADAEMTDAAGEAKPSTPEEAMFRVCVVDPTGTNELLPLIDDDRPLNLDATQSLAINWTDVLSRVYKQEEENNIESHTSVRRGGSHDDDDDDELTRVALSECLSLFTTTEKLGPEDPWYCNRCKEHRQATKKFDLWRMPPVLVVHLKRFSYRNRYYFREKLETFVDYPLQGLDLTPWVIAPDFIAGDGEEPAPPPIYDLYAVSNHYGSLGGGHYTAYAKNRNSGKWYKFDDSHVAEVPEASVKTSAAYVLFYIRRGAYNAPTPTVVAEPAAAGGAGGAGASDVGASTTTTTATTTTTHSFGREEGEDEDPARLMEPSRMRTTDLHALRRQHHGSESDDSSGDELMHNGDAPRERKINTRLQPESDESDGDDSDHDGVRLR